MLGFKIILYCYFFSVFCVYSCRCDRTLYPPDLKNFIEKHEAVTTSGNSSKGEGLDAQLEEVNKASKCWENGAMTAREWLTIFRNHDELAKVFFQSTMLYPVYYYFLK